MRRAGTLTALAVWLLMPVTASGQADARRATAGPPAPSPPVAIARLGPQVGTTVPAFALTDHRGQSRTLDSLMGPRGMLLVFSRSADW